MIVVALIIAVIVGALAFYGGERLTWTLEGDIGSAVKSLAETATGVADTVGQINRNYTVAKSAIQTGPILLLAVLGVALYALRR